MDEQGNLLLETPDMRTVFSESVHPQKIITDNDLVYLADTANGIFVFDNYGSFKKKIPVKGWQALTIANNTVISIHNERITVFNSSTQLETQRDIPFFKPYFHSFVTPSKLIHFSDNTVQVYQYRF